MRVQILTVTLVLLLASAVAPGPTAATTKLNTIYVCWNGSGDYTTIQHGMNAAWVPERSLDCLIAAEPDRLGA